ncbi:MAG: cation diffusion facilitator family transporter [Actinomycetota bacterium]
MSHDHSPRPVTRSMQTRALWVALSINSVLLVAEVIGAIMFGSLALFADAAHLLSDVFGLAIALGAHRLMARPASARHSYGMQRAEVLGALANGVMLAVIVVWISYESIRRILDPPTVDGPGLLVVGVIGLAINAGSAVLLHRASGDSLNMRGAFVHMVSDALGSLATVVAAVAIVVWSAHWADPVASLVIATVIVWATWGLLREAIHVLLEATPRGLDPAEVGRALDSAPGVESVHHLHLWNLASDVRALSAHIVLRGPLNLHEAQNRSSALKAMLQDRFRIEHATLELECHDCEAAADPHESAGASARTR